MSLKAVQFSNLILKYERRLQVVTRDQIISLLAFKFYNFCKILILFSKFLIQSSQVILDFIKVFSFSVAVILKSHSHLRKTVWSVAHPANLCWYSNCVCFCYKKNGISCYGETLLWCHWIQWTPLNSGKGMNFQHWAVYLSEMSVKRVDKTFLP